MPYAINGNVDRHSLIFDRTQADIDLALSLKRQNLPLPYDNLKIAWDWRALKRIESFCEHLADKLNSLGFTVTIDTKTDWTKESLNSEADGFRILKNINNLKAAVPNLPFIPTTPESATRLTYSQANDIERILFVLDESVYYIGTIYPITGTIRTGQVKLRARRS